MTKKPRQVVIPLDEDETAFIFVWHNGTKTLYEISVSALGGDIVHSFERLEKLGEENDS